MLFHKIASAFLKKVEIFLYFFKKTPLKHWQHTIPIPCYFFDTANIFSIYFIFSIIKLNSQS